MMKPPNKHLLRCLMNQPLNRGYCCSVLSCNFLQSNSQMSLGHLFRFQLFYADCNYMGCLIDKHLDRISCQLLNEFVAESASSQEASCSGGISYPMAMETIFSQPEASRRQSAVRSCAFTVSLTNGEYSIGSIAV